MLQAMLNFFFCLLIRALAQEMLAVSEFTTVCLWLFLTGLKALLEMLALSKTKTAPVLLGFVYIKTFTL